MRFLAFVAVAALLVAGCAIPSTAPDMPAFSDSLQDMQDFYRFEFLPDGYPGRQDDGEVWAHPIYGVYVLNDYLDQHEQQPTDELETAIRTVAEATVDRMDDHRGTLVFWYQADPERGARLYERHYSGLTQSYYAVALHRTGERLNDQELIDAAARVFDSLLVPVEDGGVWHEGPYGPGVAEVPQEPVSWILNGWQSALVSMHQYAELSDSAEASEAVRESVEAMADMLPLYDVPDLANSRYGLTGYTYLRLNMDKPAGLSDVSLDVPGEGTYPVPVGEGTRWQNHIFPEDAGTGSVRINAVLSRVSHPRPNRLSFTVDGAVDVTVQAQVGEYDPLSSAPVDPEWTDVGTATAEPGEETTVDIPQEIIDRVAYPTNFVKEIRGENVNLYHVVHIKRLRQLADRTGTAELAVWADRWEGYICRWDGMDMYDGLMVRSLVGGPSTVRPSASC